MLPPFYVMRLLCARNIGQLVIFGVYEQLFPVVLVCELDLAIVLRNIFYTIVVGCVCRNSLALQYSLCHGDDLVCKDPGVLEDRH